MKRATITVKIAYDEATVSDPLQLKMALEQEIHHQVGDGLLTPTGEEIVDEWDVEITVD